MYGANSPGIDACIRACLEGTEAFRGLETLPELAPAFVALSGLAFFGVLAVLAILSLLLGLGLRVLRSVSLEGSRENGFVEEFSSSFLFFPFFLLLTNCGGGQATEGWSALLTSHLCLDSLVRLLPGIMLLLASVSFYGACYAANGRLVCLVCPVVAGQ